MELKTTRFTKDAKPTLNDVILTNRKNLLQNTTNLYCGLSDVHNIISAQMKSDMPSTKKPFKTYRSYKQLNEEKFLQDLEQANLTTLIENEDNVNEAYNTFHTKLMDIVDNHMPMKKRKTVHKPAPFMNQQLRKAIYKKQMLHNKYLHLKSKKNWETYRQQRNFVNKLRRQSVRNYFVERCTDGPKQKDFWPTIKPFLTNKGRHFENNIILCNNDEIINNQSDVAEIFNNYFVNVAKDIGSESCTVDDNHPSIQAIRENCNVEGNLSFTEISDDFVEKQINKINVNKAT